jgi:prepilin-type N-terminal cleavage/methylation domain-containing protein
VRRGGFTITELVVCLIILALLATILMPSLTQAKIQARGALCCSNLHGIGVGIQNYVAAHNQQLPPFAFSDVENLNVPISGHWGGASRDDDPALFGRRGVEAVNLWSLVKEDMLWESMLICPGSGDDLVRMKASYFPYSLRYSTYCLRFPTSRDLFDQSRNLTPRSGLTIGIYAQAAGGQSVRVGAYYQQVPQVRMDRSYHLANGAEYDAANSALVADNFWRRDYVLDQPDSQIYPVRWNRCHQTKFNVLTGCGAMRSRHDDGTIAANTPAGSDMLGDDKAGFATYAENVWRFLERGD